MKVYLNYGLRPAHKMKQERVIIPYRQPSLSLLTSAIMINNLSSVHSFIWSAAVNLDYTNFQQMASFHVNIISPCKTVINIHVSSASNYEFNTTRKLWNILKGARAFTLTIFLKIACHLEFSKFLKINFFLRKSKYCFIIANTVTETLPLR